LIFSANGNSFSPLISFRRNLRKPDCFGQVTRSAQWNLMWLGVVSAAPVDSAPPASNAGSRPFAFRLTPFFDEHQIRVVTIMGTVIRGATIGVDPIPYRGRDSFDPADIGLRPASTGATSRL
jgi:hypothetical protein